MKKTIMMLFATLAMGFFFNAQACKTGLCNKDGDCNSYAPICTSGKAYCKGEWDEDPFKSGTQGCHGNCVCKSGSSSSSVSSGQKKKPEPAKPKPAKPAKHKRPAA
ncbi:hypothetical protein [Legionella nagasakiensis]|uniref:hypothetical protein n=1 Tax=Legionella nagasakiensis TaxID=535290 RepID=UPI0010558954|nr:hypothetical protein [Legionella nagasakiensis]